MNAPFPRRISVEDYIRRGDNDETAGIQRALDVACALAGVTDGYGPGIKVCLSSGNWRVSQTLNIRDGCVSLVGEGRASTRISRSTDYGDTLYIAPPDFAITNYQPGNHVSGITFAHFGVIPTTGAHIHHAACARYDVIECDFVGMYGGIDIESCNTGINYERFGVYTDYDFWTPGGVNPGSFCIRVRENASVLGYKPPSEVFFSNFNLRGGNKDPTTAYCLDKALHIQSCDGLWFSNGHLGFAKNQSCLLEPSGSSQIIQSIEFANTYFDGNFKGSTGLGMSKSNGGEILAIQHANCVFKNHTGDGIFSTFSAGAPSDFSFANCNIANNANSGVNINGGSLYRFANCTIKDNGSSNANAPQVILGNISDSQFLGGAIGRTTGRAGYGILVSGAPDRILAAGINFFGNTTDIGGSLGPNSTASLNIHG